MAFSFDMADASIYYNQTRRTDEQTEAARAQGQSEAAQSRPRKHAAHDKSFDHYSPPAGDAADAGEYLQRYASGVEPFTQSGGDKIQDSKKKLLAVLYEEGASQQEIAVIFAMAMQETDDMDVEKRDTGKDECTDGSKNVSMFNLSIYMMQQLGYAQDDNGESLNDPSNLHEVVHLLLSAFDKWGIERTLNMVRGGSTGFEHGGHGGQADDQQALDMDCDKYRKAIAASANYIMENPDTLYDDQRVAINLRHI